MSRTILWPLLALMFTAQDTPITHARIHLARKPEPAVRITLVNRRASALTQVQIKLYPGGAEHGVIMHNSYQPLDAHAERTFDLRTGGTSIDHASVTLAVFEDGYYQGAPDAVEEWQKDRQALADDLVFWIGVLSTMPRISEPDLRRYLTNHVAEHKDAPQARKDSMRVRIKRLLETYPSGPDIWLPLDALKDEAQGDLAALRRPLPAPDAAAGDTSPVAAVEMTARLKATTNTVVALADNLGQAPIEAIGFEVFEGDGWVRSGQSTDYCPARPGDAPENPRYILPGDTRESPVAVAPPGDDAAFPPIQLTFVLFTDGTFE